MMKMISAQYDQEFEEMVLQQGREEIRLPSAILDDLIDALQHLQWLHNRGAASQRVEVREVEE